MANTSTVPNLLVELLKYTGCEKEIHQNLDQIIEKDPEAIFKHLQEVLLQYHEEGKQTVEEIIIATLVKCLDEDNSYIEQLYGKTKKTHEGLYIGQKVENEKSGLGIRIYYYDTQNKRDPNMRVYVGEWQKDERHGTGCMYDNGDYYSGNWYEDQKHGTGCMRYKNDETYKGEWKKDQRHGLGCTYKNGDYYSGNWFEDQKCGIGCMKYKNGETYEGSWIDDKREREGIMEFNNNKKFCGRWKQDKMQMGTFSNEKEKWNFFGEFEDECPTYGTLTDNSGKKYSNSWTKVRVFDKKPETNQEQRDRMIQTKIQDEQKKIQDDQTKQENQKNLILETLKKAAHNAWFYLTDDGWGARMEAMGMFKRRN